MPSIRYQRLARSVRLRNRRPGTAADTLHALKQLPTPPKALLRIGCGKGAATMVLANVLTQRVKPLNMSMADIDFPDEFFDTLWCDIHLRTEC